MKEYFNRRRFVLSERTDKAIADMLTIIILPLYFRGERWERKGSSAFGGALEIASERYLSISLKPTGIQHEQSICSGIQETERNSRG